MFLLTPYLDGHNAASSSGSTCDHPVPSFPCLLNRLAREVWKTVSNPGLMFQASCQRVAPSFPSVCHDQRSSETLEKREHLQRKPQQRQCSGQRSRSASQLRARCTPVPPIRFQCLLTSVFHHIQAMSSVLVCPSNLHGTRRTGLILDCSSVLRSETSSFCGGQCRGAPAPPRHHGCG